MYNLYQIAYHFQKRVNGEKFGNQNLVKLNAKNCLDMKLGKKIKYYQKIKNSDNINNLEEQGRNNLSDIWMGKNLWSNKGEDHIR